jgi:hypothetical protein
MGFVRAESLQFLMVWTGWQILASRATQGYTSPQPMTRTQHQDAALLFYSIHGQCRFGGNSTPSEEDPTKQCTFGPAAIPKEGAERRMLWSRGYRALRVAERTDWRWAVVHQQMWPKTSGRTICHIAGDQVWTYWKPLRK